MIINYKMLIIVGLIEFENLKTEDKEKLLKENCAKANKRQSECRKTN